jgi:hypothetical protein
MEHPPNAYIDPADGLRYYRFNDKALVSVTSLRRVVGMPMALANWQVSQVVKAAEAMRGTVYEGTLDDGEYRRVLRAGAMAERNAAANLGTDVHEAAAAGVRSTALLDDDPRVLFMRSYEHWLERKKPVIYLREKQVFNISEGYAGSFDLIAEVDGVMTLIDLKTGKGAYNDYAIQLAHYMNAEFIGGYDPIDDRDVIYEDATAIFRQVKQMAVLHLRPEGWGWYRIPATDDLRQAALAMARLARFFIAHPDLSTLSTKETYP